MCGRSVLIISPKYAIWSLRKSLTPGCRNILHPALVDRSNVILPLLHIKLGLMKKFVNALKKEDP